MGMIKRIPTTHVREVSFPSCDYDRADFSFCHGIAGKLIVPARGGLQCTFHRDICIFSEISRNSRSFRVRWYFEFRNNIPDLMSGRASMQISLNVRLCSYATACASMR